MPSTSRPLATLCLSLTLAGAAAPLHTAAALGLGAIEASTWLGKPFDALIPINRGAEEVADPESELKVGLGTAADYERLGVEPAAVHRQLVISTERRNGATYIRVRTREPLQEPYLDFVLAVRWAQGQVVRGFTVFVDPPPNAAVASAPKAAPPTRPPTVSVAPSVPLPPAPLDLPAGTYATRQGDSLWQIARDWSDGRRVNAAMDAIIVANPDAFIGGDPSRLREGVTLTLPGSQPAVAPRSQPESAIAVATSSAVAPAAVPPPRLEVVATPATPVEVAPEHAVYNERVGAITHQVDDLEESLQSSRARLERMDKQLRGLMAAYDRQRDGGARPQPAAMTVAASAGAGSPGSSAASFGAVGSTLTLQPMAAASDTDWPAWSLHAGYGSGIAALAAWVAWLTWRRQPARGLARVGPEAGSGPLPRSPVSERRDAQNSVPLAAAPAAVPGGASRPAGVDRSGVPIGSSMPMSTFAEESVDAGISAGVFIAFGRMSEAEQVLVEALEQQPDRFDLQMQLLDLYLQTENGAAFERLGESMAAQHADDEAVLDELSILREAYDASRN